MTTSRALEYRITRHLLRRQDQVRHRTLSQRGLAERIIAAAAVIAGAVLLGSLLQELLWALLAAGTILTLGIKN